MIVQCFLNKELDNVEVTSATKSTYTTHLTYDV
jgi:hypothetical protein